MNAPLTAVGNASELEAPMMDDRPEARARGARARAARRRRRKTARSPAWPPRSAARNRRFSPPMRRMSRRRNPQASAAAFLDRLQLNASARRGHGGRARCHSQAEGSGREVTASWRRPNGMRIERVRVPLGVVGMIYESRPNVTADAGALMSESRQRRDPARRLRKLSFDARYSRRDGRRAIGSRAAGSRDFAGADARPRGRRHDARGARRRHRRHRSARRQKSCCTRPGGSARSGVCPPRSHCHVYVDGAAKLPMAKKIVLNAKMRRTGVCGAAETLLVDRAAAPQNAQAADRHADRCRLRDPRR